MRIRGPLYPWPAKRVRSWEGFTNAVEELQVLWPNADRKMFRGQVKERWGLVPSFTRDLQGHNLDELAVIRLEHQLVDQFRREAHRELSPSVIPQRDRVVSWIPLMRHFGAPTRVLDWSLSPYVAAYFAVEKDWDADGAVWWFVGSAAENLMVREYGAGYKTLIEETIESPESTTFDVGMPPAIFMLELKRTIDRMGNQQSLCTLCLDPLRDHAEILAPLAGYGDGPHCGRVIIPSA